MDGVAGPRVAAAGVDLGGVAGPGMALDWCGVVGWAAVERGGVFLATGLEHWPLAALFSKTLPASSRGLGGRGPMLGLGSFSADAKSRASSSLRICWTLSTGESWGV